MNEKKILTIGIFLPLAVLSFFCKVSHPLTNDSSIVIPDCCIETFKLKYQIALGGGKIKKIDNDIFVGTSHQDYIVQNKVYQKLIFGDSISSTIAMVRQNEGALIYILSIDDTSGEKPLLYFDKPVDFTWKVKIENSYFWQKVIMFEGVEYIENERVYVYNVATEKGYTSLANAVSKIYYSKEHGFLKFIFKTHWGSIEVGKPKPRWYSICSETSYFFWVKQEE